MLPRERVLQAIRHQPTDRMPADFQAKPQVCERLQQRLGLRDREELMQCLEIDMRPIICSYGIPNSEPDEEGYVRNLWGVRTNPSLPDGDPAKVLYLFDEDTTVDDVYAHPWPSAEDSDYSWVTEAVAKHHDRYATYGSPWCPFFHDVGWTIGQETFFIWMYTKPEVTEAIIDCMVSFEIEATRKFFDECRGKLDIAYFGNDFGTQRGLFISPECYLRFIRQPLKRYFDLAHDYGCLVMQHSCGAIRDIIPWLIEDGVDILDPIQMRADGMALPSLACDFGDRLTLHGGVDTQHTLPFGTPEEVRAQVQEYRNATRDNGGYLLCGSQELIEDIPDDNILAMYDMKLR